jgi:hypothetical protein
VAASLNDPHVSVGVLICSVPGGGHRFTAGDIGDPDMGANEGGFG